MSLNDYRDEAKEFLEKVESEDEPLEKDIERLEEELQLLRKSLGSDLKLRHQIYDILFILFSLSAKKDLDLDEEWKKGKREKEGVY